LTHSPTAVSSEDSVSSAEDEELTNTSQFSDLVWNNLESELFPMNQFLEDAVAPFL